MKRLVAISLTLAIGAVALFWFYGVVDKDLHLPGQEPPDDRSFGLMQAKGTSKPPLPASTRSGSGTSQKSNPKILEENSKPLPLEPLSPGEQNGGMANQNYRKHLYQHFIDGIVRKQDSSLTIKSLFNLGISPVEFGGGHPDTGQRRIYHAEHPEKGISFIRLAYDLDGEKETFAFMHLGLSRQHPWSLRLGEDIEKSLGGDVKLIKKGPNQFFKWSMPDGYILWTKAYSKDQPSFMPDFPEDVILSIELPME